MLLHVSVVVVRLYIRLPFFRQLYGEIGIRHPKTSIILAISINGNATIFFLSIIIAVKIETEAITLSSQTIVKQGGSQ